MAKTTKAELADQFVEQMQRMRAAMRSRSRGQWSDFDFTMPQVRTMFFLSEGPKRMSDISEYLGRGMPSTTSMIDRLVKKGRVDRVQDPSDRRVVVCQLTSQGREVVERFGRIWHLRTESLADVLTLDELEAVVPAIEILAEAAGRDGRPSEAGHAPEPASVSPVRHPATSP